jgi:hypothetical protein
MSVLTDQRADEPGVAADVAGTGLVLRDEVQDTSLSGVAFDVLRGAGAIPDVVLVDEGHIAAYEEGPVAGA